MFNPKYCKGFLILVMGKRNRENFLLKALEKINIENCIKI